MEDSTVLFFSYMKACFVYKEKSLLVNTTICLICEILELNLRKGQSVNFFTSLEEICNFEKTLLSKKAEYMVKSHSPENQSQLA